LIGSRRALFDDIEGFVEAPLYDGQVLEIGNLVTGPALIDEPTMTIVVPREWVAILDEPGCYVLSRMEGSEGV